MFKSIGRWLSKRHATKILTKVREGLSSLSSLPPPHKHFVRAGLTHVHIDLVLRLGSFCNWNRRTRTFAMSILIRDISEIQRGPMNSMSEQAGVLGSFGCQMLFFYYDSFEMPDPEASEIRRLIEEWFDFKPE